MEFLFTPDEAQTIAQGVIRHFRAKKFNVQIEAGLHLDAPYRTTVFCSRDDLHVLVEAQHDPVYNDSLRELAR